MLIILGTLLFGGVASSPLLQGKEAVDLSHGYDESTLALPWLKSFRITDAIENEDNGVWFSVNDFATNEHVGTHIDAPVHFIKGGTTLGDMPLDKFFVNGVVVNMTSEVNGNWEYKMGAGPLEAWEAAHGPMPDNSVVLLLFGWAAHWPDKHKYLGPSDTDLRFPTLTTEAVEWLANKTAVVGIGVDTVSPDLPGGASVPTHTILLGNNKYILENVNTPRPLPHLVQLVVMPMKITKGTGGPTRLVAIV